MFDRLDAFAKTLPEPKFGADWEAFYGQHIRNAERMRSQAFKFAVLDIGRGLRAAGRALGARLGAIRRQARAGLTPADASQGGAD